MNLIEALQTVPDYRKAREKRHPLWIILVFIRLVVKYYSARLFNPWFPSSLG